MTCDDQFSLAKEVLSSLKAPAVNPSQFLTAPMVKCTSYYDHLLDLSFP